MNIKTAKEIVKQYTANEEINAHSENLLLLAKHLGDEKIINQCLNRIQAVQQGATGYRFEVPEESIELLNAFYYEIKAKADSAESAEYIDCTPTWADIAPILLNGLRSNEPHVRAGSEIELSRVCQIADRYNRVVKISSGLIEKLSAAAEAGEQGELLSPELCEESRHLITALRAILKS